MYQEKKAEENLPVLKIMWVQQFRDAENIETRL